jgi:hypothetical protein
MGCVYPLVVAPTVAVMVVIVINEIGIADMIPRTTVPLALTSEYLPTSELISVTDTAEV